MKYLLLLCCWTLMAAAEPARTEIWLAPQSILPKPLPSTSDFMQLFEPDAPWKFTAAHVQVFKLYSGFVGHAGQDQVNAVVSDLKRRKIALALETGAIDAGVNSKEDCGGLGKVEGYGTPAQARRICQRIKSAGGSLDFLVMDEPLYYGHYSTKAHTCHDSIETVLSQVVSTLRVYTAEFPDIQLGEVEPARFPEYANWQADLKKWAEGFRTSMNRTLAFFQMDIPWTDDGRMVPGADSRSKQPDDTVALYRFLERLKAEHLLGKIGVIHNGTAEDASGGEWVRKAQNHISVIEGQYKLKPDQVIFQSWMTQPDHTLPETAPDTLTGLVRSYLESLSPSGAAR